MAAKERFGQRTLVVLTLAVIAAFVPGCVKQKTILPPQEIVARFDERAERQAEVVVTLMAETIRDYDAGAYGSTEDFTGLPYPSLEDEARVLAACDELVANEIEFSESFDGVELTDAYWDREQESDLPLGAHNSAVLAALVAEGMIDIVGYPLPDQVELRDKFPEIIPNYDDLLVESPGQLDGVGVRQVRRTLSRGYSLFLSACYSDRIIDYYRQ